VPENILSLETSGSVGSVAALVGARLLCERPLDPRWRCTQTLAPALHDLLGYVGWRAAEVRLVAVSIGPGSFTSLRVGVTTAKAFAYATGASVLAINTLEAVAERAPAEARKLAVLIDAQRDEVFVGHFMRADDGRFQLSALPQIVAVERLLSILPEGTHLSGPALGRLVDRLPTHVMAVDQHLWHPTATDVGRLASRFYAAGRRDDMWTLAPFYMRASAAEEKLAGRRDRQRPA